MEINEMNLALMEEIQQAFQDAVRLLSRTQMELQRIADSQDPIILGHSGSAFTEAIRDVILPSTEKLAHKCDELQRDVAYAVRVFREADQQTTSTI